MTRRPAAFLSAATLCLAGLAGVAVALAPGATAAPGDPTLGSLTFAPETPELGDTVFVSGTGCVGLPNLPTELPTLPSIPAGSAGSADAAAPAAEPAATADPAAAPAAAADDPIATVSITISGPDGDSNDSADPNLTGEWTGEGITVQSPGDYTVSASCDITGLGNFSYDPVSFTIDAPQEIDPAVVCTGCTSVKAGGTVTVAGTGFPASTSATVALEGYDSKNAGVDANGGVAPVSFVIRADQAVGTLDGSITAPGAAPEPFTVTVTAPTQPGGDQDGDVPGDPAPAPTTGADDVDTTNYSDTSGGTNYTSSAPTLPATGTDTVWSGVIGAALLVAGGGLLWAGRRRDEADAPTGTA